jgi:hypothetical protein
MPWGPSDPTRWSMRFRRTVVILPIGAGASRRATSRAVRVSAQSARKHALNPSKAPRCPRDRVRRRRFERHIVRLGTVLAHVCDKSTE